MGQATFGIVATIIATICLPGNSEAQETEPAIARVGADFVERFEEFGRVRGDIVMGTMLGLPESTGSPDAPPRANGDVAVSVLPTADADATARLFCVRLSSKDGRFESENTYEVTHPRPEPGAPFPYEGEHDEIVQSKKIVSNISLGPCGNRVETIIPSNWADAGKIGPERALYLFLNSAGNPAFVEIDGAPLVECRDISDEETLKYTAACLLPAATLDAQRGSDGQVPVTVIVSRMLGEDTFPIRIFWPEPDA